MLRTTIIRTARVAARRCPTAAAFTSIRLNSTQTPAPASTKPPKTEEQRALKAALEKQDDLQRDWDAKVIPYEQFIAKVENPLPVRVLNQHACAAS